MITHQRLLEILHYDPSTGVWHWRVTRGGSPAGSVAGSLNKARDSRRSAFYRLSVGGRRILSSRLAWFYMTGQWPVFEIDHRNKDSLDNRWENLRSATRLQNEINKGPYRNNRSGRKGVFVKSDGTIQSAIRRGGKRVWLGNFPTVEAAAFAYAEAARAVDGEFLRVA